MCAWCERFEDAGDADACMKLEVIVEGEAAPEQSHCICPDCCRDLGFDPLPTAA